MKTTSLIVGLLLTVNVHAADKTVAWWHNPEAKTRATLCVPISKKAFQAIVKNSESNIVTGKRSHMWFLKRPDSNGWPIYYTGGSKLDCLQSVKTGRELGQALLVAEEQLAKEIMPDEPGDRASYRAGGWE